MALWAPGCAALQQPQPPVEELAVHGRQTSILLGLRSFEDGAWDDLDDQALFALDYCEPIPSSPLRLEGGLHYSWDEGNGTLAGGGGVSTHVETFEGSAGANYTVLVGRFRPYVGFGAALLWLDVKGEENGAVFRDEAVTVGGYLKGGILLQVSPKAHFGLEYRHLEGGEIDLGSQDASSNYDQFALVFGTSF
jgi:hypothetical protein